MKVALLTTDSRDHFKEYAQKDPYFGTAPAALLEGFALDPEHEIHVLSCTQHPLISPARLAPNIRFHSLLVPKWGWLRTAYAGCIGAVTQRLRMIQPDIVHAQGTERDCAISGVFFRGAKVLTIHGNCRAIAQLHRARPFSFWWLQARLERFCLPRFDGVVCISRYTQNWVSGSAKKTWLLPNAVDPTFFEIRREPSVHEPLILVVANVDSRKNQIGLIRSLDFLSSQRRFQVRFFGKCGEDAYGKEFRELVQARSWCFWGGMLDRERLREEFSRAAAVMLPTWEDNCPMVVLEAQAAGIPIIASDVGGVPDLVQNGLNGILTNPARPETMPEALAKILDRPEWAQQIAEAGRSQALSRFHPRAIAGGHLEIYREVIASR